VATAARTSDSTIRTSESPRFRPLSRLRDLWGYREILLNLVRKDLKVKYTQSILGAAWSMLNPILYLAVFGFVFSFVLQSDIPAFPVYLLSGLVAWTFFQGSLNLGVKAVVDNTSLVKKVYFPKEILPLAPVGVSLVDFALQVVVLIAFMLLFGYGTIGTNLLLFPLALVALIIFTTALTMWIAALNVRYRDTQHLLAQVLLVWFWLTPIVYPASLIQETLIKFGGQKLFWAYLALNPMADITFAFQKAFYGTSAPIGADGQPTQVLGTLSTGDLALLCGGVIVGATILLAFTARTFFRMSGDFAEEL
jgi:ABC-2 type transport system permease protein